MVNSKKKPSRLLLFSALALFIALISWGATGPTDPVPTPSQLVGEHARVLTPQTERLAALGKARKGAQHARHLDWDGITRISQLNAGALRTVPEGQALEYLRVAAWFCESQGPLNGAYRRKQLSRADLSPRQKQAHAFYAQFTPRFCDEPTQDSGMLALRLMDLPPDDDILEVHGLQLLDDDEQLTVGVPLAERMLVDTDSPDAVEHSAMFLLHSTGDLPQARGLPMPASIRDDAQLRADAQMMAVRMVTCQMRGGCGSNGFYTAMYCFSGCRPGVSLSQAWTESYPPDVMTYVRRLAFAIEANRNSGAASDVAQRLAESPRL